MEEFISIGPDALGANSWKLVLDWCAAATQMDTGGGSMVAIGVEAPLSEDKGFLEWCTQKLDGCLGAKSIRPGLAAHAG